MLVFQNSMKTWFEPQQHEFVLISKQHKLKLEFLKLFQISKTQILVRIFKKTSLNSNIRVLLKLWPTRLPKRQVQTSQTTSDSPENDQTATTWVCLELQTSCLILNSQNTSLSSKNLKFIQNLWSSSQDDKCRLFQELAPFRISNSENSNLSEHIWTFLKLPRTSVQISDSIVETKNTSLVRTSSFHLSRRQVFSCNDSIKLHWG